MDVVHIRAEIERDGELVLRDLPWRKGQKLELTVAAEPDGSRRKMMTARDLLQSGLVGIWRDRMDIGDSSSFARDLRAQVECRGR